MPTHASFSELHPSTCAIPTTQQSLTKKAARTFKKHMRISKSLGMSSLINQYCTAHGLRSEQGKRLNGKECFVAKFSDVGSERLAVLFTDDVRSNPATSAFMSLKAENLTPKYDVAVRPSSIADNGLFATKSFKKGDVIIQEYPYVTLPSGGMPMPNIRIPGDGSPVEWRFLADCVSPAMREVLQTLTIAGASAELLANVKMQLGGVLPPLRNYLTSLGREDEAKRCDVCPIVSEDLIRWNINGVGSSDGSSVNLHVLISRLNHSCNANTSWYVSPTSDIGSNLRYITACRDIEAGEELLVSYAHFTKFGARRRKALMGYGVKCSCCFCRPSPAFEGAFNRALNAIETLETIIDEDAFNVRSEAHLASLVEVSDDAIADAEKAFLRIGHGDASFVGGLKCGVKFTHVIGLMRAVRFDVMNGKDAAKRLEDIFEERVAAVLSSVCFGNVAHPAYLDAVADLVSQMEIARKVSLK